MTQFLSQARNFKGTLEPGQPQRWMGGRGRVACHLNHSFHSSCGCGYSIERRNKVRAGLCKRLPLGAGRCGSRVVTSQARCAPMALLAGVREQLAQLTDGVVRASHGVPHCVRAHKDLVVVAALRRRGGGRAGSDELTATRERHSTDAGCPTPAARDERHGHPPLPTAGSGFVPPLRPQRSRNLLGSGGLSVSTQQKSIPTSSCSALRLTKGRARKARAGRRAGTRAGPATALACVTSHLEGLVPEEVNLVKVLLDKPQAVGLVPALQGNTMQQGGVGCGILTGVW